MLIKAPFTQWPTKRGKIITIILVVIIVLFTLSLIGYLSIASKVQTILPGNLLEIAKSDPLKTSNGRTNILVFGTSNDDPNPSHTGGNLVDSLIVLSIDKQAKSVHSVSIPRDLWVEYSTACGSGSSGKINAVYQCALGSQTQNDTRGASQALTDKIGGIIGLPIQYYVQVDYTTVRTLTDALGGIDVDIHSQDERGIYDPNVGLKVPTGVVHLDGKTALKLARARNAAGGYGLPRSNFDREINQQRIFMAILKKASTSGQLSDPGNALQLLNDLNGHLQTNVATSELRSAVGTAASLDLSKLISIPLVEHMTTGNIGGQSVVLPASGQNNYAEIQTHISNKLESGTK